jgi:hypothetical protein
MKAEMIPVIIIWANGTISKSMRKYLYNIPGKQVVKELQKTALLSTAHIPCTAKVLAYRYRILNTGHNITCTTISNHRVAATPYTPEIWFVLRI